MLKSTLERGGLAWRILFPEGATVCFLRQDAVSLLLHLHFYSEAAALSLLPVRVHHDNVDDEEAMRAAQKRTSIVIEAKREFA